MSAPRPPRLATRLLERRLHPDERDELIGDLAEQFAAQAAARGRGAASRWYWRQALTLAWGFTLHRRDVVSLTHERRAGRWAAGNLATDIRHAWRSLRHSPSFVIVAILTVTLGIGLSTAVFSLVNSILLKPLPYAYSNRLVRLAEYRPKDPIPAVGGSLSDTAVGMWLARGHDVEALTPYMVYDRTATTPLGADNITVAEVGGSFFDVLGTQPEAGRLLLPSDAERTATPTVVISDRLWTSAFSHRSDVVGRTMIVEQINRVIVGVAPASFSFPDADVDLWIPGTWRWPAPGTRRNFGMSIDVIGRLRADASIDDANAEGASIARAMATAEEEFAEAPVEPVRMRVRRLLDDIVAPVRPALTTLGVGIALVLVAACVSLATLIVTRHTSRQRDLAVRLALGASRWRIVRPVLVEQLLLAGNGTALGATLAWWVLRALPVFAPADLPRLKDVHFDVAALALTTATAFITVVVTGLVPVWRMPATDVRELAASGRMRVGHATRSADGIRSVLVIGQVALAVMLLVGALLIGRSLGALLHVNPGYRPQGVLTFQLALPEGIWNQPGRESRLFTELLDRLQKHPSVVSAGAAAALPLHQRASRTSINVEGRPAPADRFSQPMAFTIGTTTDYLRTVGTRVLRGRGFNDQDTMDAPKVVLIDETVERLAFPNEDPIGKRVHGPRGFWTIIGVVEAVHMGVLGQDAQAVFYYHALQLPELLGYGHRGSGIAVRTTGDPIDLAAFVREQARQIEPTIPVFNVTRLSDDLSTSVAQPRFYAVVLGLFAMLSLSTALLGIYGVLAYSVERRRLEFGVRRALGAAEHHVIGLVMQRGFVLAAIGTALGLAGAGIGARFMRAMLFGITPADPLSYAGAAVLAASVVFAASWQPVRRALRIDPARALRME